LYILGLKRKTIKLIPHQKMWDDYFIKEKKRIQKAIPEIYVEHVGSTAIPSICAKPIIDIALGIDKMKDFNKYKNKLTKLGYKYHANRGSRFNKIFTKGPADCRVVYIHLVRYKGKHWQKYINFRDKLIKNKKLAKEYERLKIKLAKEFENRDYYTKAKEKFISNIINS